MIKLIKKLFATKPRMSAEEAWLAKSSDLVELERRQKQLQYNLNNQFTKGWN